MSIPSDAELDALILARLALAGIDLNQLPTTPDSVTGSPTRAQAMESLRTFLAGSKVNGVRSGGTVAALSTWQPLADPALAQHDSPPLEYPSITTAWTEAHK